MKSVAPFLKFIKEHVLVLTLIILLGIGLVLGDGKQALIDVYTAAGMLVLFLLARWFLKKHRNVPSVHISAWSVLLTYLFIRTLFSDDVGYSLYVFIRYVEAFLVYYLFVCYGGKNTVRVFSDVLISFSVIILLFSVILTLSPGLLHYVPPMNLLYKTYGHNHAADIVIFGFSSAALLWVSTGLRKYLILLMIFVAGTMFFLARTVLVLEVLFLNGAFFYFFIWKKYINKTLLIVGPLLTAATIVIICIPYTSLHILPKLFPSFGKQSVLLDQRWEYWRQSLVAISKRPWFGSGPGTFFLQSKLYQKEPNAYSWFAHNFLLEHITETGFVGLVLTVFLAAAMIRNSKIRLTPFTLALITSLGLVFAQSLVDYNLDYAEVWILTWAVIGAVMSQTVTQNRTANRIPLNTISVVIVGIFYLLNMVLLSGKNVITKTYLYAPLCAYDFTCASSLLSQKYSAGETPFVNIDKAILFFHRKNPDILALLAAKYQFSGDSVKSDMFYRDALRLDPQNNVIFGTYISDLLDNRRQDVLLGVVQQMITTISVNPSRDTNYVKSHWKDINKCFNSSTLLWSKDQLANTYHAKSIYYAGLCLTKNLQYDEARELLRIASDARTSWSNIYLDYAGLSYWKYHDIKAAKQAILYCKANHNSRKHCESFDNRPLPRASVTDEEARFI